MTQEKHTRPKFDLTVAALHGAIAGLTMPVDSFEVVPGLSLQSSYAHLIAPFVMAFARPSEPNAPHPGPWAALQERGLDITAEIVLCENSKPLNFDRLNTLWFAIALLRLRTAQPIRMPILADRPLSSVSKGVDAAQLIPVELQIVAPITAPIRAVNLSDLKWLTDNIHSADRLMQAPSFNRAFQTLDQAGSVENAGAGIVIAWASIETLILPGSRHITDRLSRALATYLNQAGPERDRSFQKIKKSYEARGSAAHAGLQPEQQEFETAFGLARSTIMRCIESGELPEIDGLLERWRSKS